MSKIHAISKKYNVRGEDYRAAAKASDARTAAAEAAREARAPSEADEVALW
jgi:hypothetical protein